MPQPDVQYPHMVGAKLTAEQYEQLALLARYWGYVHRGAPNVSAAVRRLVNDGLARNAPQIGIQRHRSARAAE